MLCHFRLVHPSFQYMKHLFSHLFSHVDVFILSCDVYIQAKQYRFSSKPYKQTQPFTLIHSDVSELSKITTASRKRWFMTFIYDHICLTWGFLISNKSQVTSIFQNFYYTKKTQFNTKIVILRSDDGCEFQNHSLNKFLSSKGIYCSPKLIWLHPPSKMRLLKEKNPHLLAVAHFFMLSTSFPFLSVERCGS